MNARCFRTPPIASGLICLSLAICGTAQTVRDMAPQMGLLPGGLYSIDKLETIDRVSGNVMYRIPLASLPKVGSAEPFQLALTYNSQTLRAAYGAISDPRTGGPNTYATKATLSIEGDWKFNINYALVAEDRVVGDVSTCNTSNTKTHRLYLQTADGARHYLSLYGYIDDAGYYAADPWAGQVANCNPPFDQITAPLTYFTEDGTYIRVSVLDPGSGPNTHWKAYFPDGSAVSGILIPATNMSSAYYPQSLTIADRNLNTTTIAYNSTTDQIVISNAAGSITIAGPNSATTTVSAPGFGGVGRTWTLHRQLLNFTGGTGAYTCNTLNDPCSSAFSEFVTTSLDLPSPSTPLSFNFGYSTTGGGWGNLSSVQYPSGVIVKYSYKLDGNGTGIDDGSGIFLSNPVTSKKVDYTEIQDGASTPREDIWTFAYPGASANGSCNTMTAPNNGVDTVCFQSLNPSSSAFLSGVVYKHSSPSGNVDEKLYSTNPPAWRSSTGDMNPYISVEARTLAGQSSVASVTTHIYSQNGNETQTNTYDWIPYSSLPRDGSGHIQGPGSAAPLRSVTDNYTVSVPVATNAPFGGPQTPDNSGAYWFPSSPALLHLLARSVTTGAGPGAATENSYDGNGNVLETRRWDSTKAPGVPTNLAAGNSVVSDFTYSGRGNVLTATDGRQIPTQYVYDSNDIFLTQITLAYQKPEAQTFSYVFDPSTGLLANSTDPNGVKTVYTYDSLDRVTKAQKAQGTGLETDTVYTYEDGNLRAVSCSDQDQTNDHALVSVIDYDQLGRVRLTRQMETPACGSADDDTTGIKIQTRYVPGNGVDYTLVSNPFREATSSAAASNGTMGWTLTTRDVDGRTNASQTFDGSGLPAPWGGNANSLGSVTTTYNAQTMTVMDQMGNVRQTAADGLGRIISVIEDPGASPHLNYQTAYTYDVAGNLTSTTQDSQTRSFSYDSLNRLSQATNPERGAVTYGYDEDGNLVSRKDARNSVATFTYDTLNRIKQKSYSNNLAAVAYTPTVNYTYDQAGLNSIGHLTDVEAVGVSTTAYRSFDVLGRPGQSTQNTANNNFLIHYAYNLTGAITSETYPSGRVVATSYDGANRIQSISGTTAQNPTPAQYTGTTAIAYAPQGAIQTLTRGDGLTESWIYNNRLQPASISVGNGSNPRSAFGLDLYYCSGKAVGCATNNGNLATASLSILGVDQNFTYDGVNRVATAAEGAAWSQTYAYDRFGNRRVSGGVVLDPFTPTMTTNFNANNQLQIQNSGYDASGNLTHIGGYGFAWDAEERLVASAMGNARTDYSYDGDGRRVVKQSDAATTIFVYDVTGHLAAEYSTGATSPECATCYLSTDQLGSTRVVTDQNGAVIARLDYLPFGEEIPQQYSGRTPALHFGATENIAQKFTGKERDQESGLDYFGARYYGSALGRFTSPDEVFADQHPGDPQSWNLYGYVRNNPFASIDPTGKGAVNAALLNSPEARKLSAGVAAYAKQSLNENKQGLNRISDLIRTVSGGGIDLGHLTVTPLTPAEEKAAQTGAVLVNFATAIAGGVKGEGGADTTSLYRAVGSAEAADISNAGAFGPSPTGGEFKGFFFNEADAQSFGDRMTQMTADPHSVVQAEAPASLVESSPPHSAATEGPGVLIKNKDLPQVKMKRPGQP